MSEEKPAVKKAPRKKKEDNPKAADAPKAVAGMPATHEHKHDAKPVEAKEEAKPETKPEPKAAEAKPKKSAKKGKVGPKVSLARGKRKTSIARAVVKKGRGVVRVNGADVSAHSNKFMKYVILEPISLLGPESNAIDVSVTVEGGGAMGQAQAARTAIAKALVGYFDDLNLRARFLEHDRSLLIEDVRRVEPKKYKGPKARARFQKSYR